MAKPLKFLNTVEKRFNNSLNLFVLELYALIKPALQFNYVILPAAVVTKPCLYFQAP